MVGGWFLVGAFYSLAIKIDPIPKHPTRQFLIKISICPPRILMLIIQRQMLGTVRLREQAILRLPVHLHIESEGNVTR